MVYLMVTLLPTRNHGTGGEDDTDDQRHGESMKYRLPGDGELQARRGIRRGVEGGRSIDNTPIPNL